MPKASIIRFSSLGDVILATAVIEALNNYGWDISFLTKPQYAPLFENDRRLSSLFEFVSLKKTISEIQSYAPDWIIDLQVNFRTSIISAMTGIPVIRTDKKTFDRRLLTRFKIGEKKPQSVVDYHLKAIEKVGIYAPNTLPKIFPTKNGICIAKKIVSDLEKPLVILHPDAKYPLKRWGKQNFIRLADLFAEHGFNAIIIGKGVDSSRIKWVDEISLETLVGLISLGDIFVGNDSGPTHMAGALGIPTIAIFGPTHPALGFVPRGKFTAYITSNVDCSPCTLHGRGKCKFDTRKCFDKIKPQNVFDSAIELYNKSKKII
ncbi:glycosyltransferase family 9 protein [bacterium]|nr:glycosyltransferase family 9 protein [bacterium]